MKLLKPYINNSKYIILLITYSLRLFPDINHLKVNIVHQSQLYDSNWIYFDSWILSFMYKDVGWLNVFSLSTPHLKIKTLTPNLSSVVTKFDKWLLGSLPDSFRKERLCFITIETGDEEAIDMAVAESRSCCASSWSTPFCTAVGDFLAFFKKFILIFYVFSSNTSTSTGWTFLKKKITTEAAYPSAWG